MAMVEMRAMVSLMTVTTAEAGAMVEAMVEVRAAALVTMAVRQWQQHLLQ